MEGPIVLHRERNALIGNMQGVRQLRNLIEVKKYKTEKEKFDPEDKPPPPPPGPPDIQEPKISSQKNSSIVYFCKREKHQLKSKAKLNLMPLLKEPRHLLLYEAAAALIRELYGEEKFFKQALIKDLEYEVLDHLITQSKANPEAETFDTFLPEEPMFREIIYKILKGTPAYSLKEKKGYPPLGDFIILDKKVPDKAVNFCFASPTLLKAFFGEKITQEILNEEKEIWEEQHKHNTIAKKALAILVLKHSQGKIKDTDYDPLFTYGHITNPEKTFIGNSQDGQIEVRKTK